MSPSDEAVLYGGAWHGYPVAPMATPKNRVPDCGLYRTPKAYPGQEDRIPAGCLVYFHNHSDSGPLPSVLAPDHNIHNRWHFHGPAIETSAARAGSSSSRRCRPRASTRCASELTFDEGRGKWPKGSIVQLGYTRTADPILFVATIRARLRRKRPVLLGQGRGPPARAAQHSRALLLCTPSPTMGRSGTPANLGH